MSKAQAKTPTIEVAEIKQQHINVILRGRTPLLINPYTESAIAAFDVGKKGRGGIRQLPTHEEVFKQKLHQRCLAKNKYGIPAAAVKRAVVAAGARFANEYSSTLSGVFRIDAEYLEIKGSRPTLHFTMARAQGRTSMPAVRPMFMPWHLDVPVTFISSLISLDALLNLFTLAGVAVGIGSFRIERNGTYGSFDVPTVTKLVIKTKG